LWTAIHLARAAESESSILTTEKKSQAAGSANRSLAFFKSFYAANGRVPEYLKIDGSDPISQIKLSMRKF